MSAYLFWIFICLLVDSSVTSMMPFSCPFPYSQMLPRSTGLIPNLNQRIGGRPFVQSAIPEFQPTGPSNLLQNTVQGETRRFISPPFSGGQPFIYSQIETELPPWEPIFDGNIIAKIGDLFSRETKEEANIERIEREERRERELLEHYEAMLNDPEGLNALQKAADESPKFINQIVSRRHLHASDDQITRS